MRSIHRRADSLRSLSSGLSGDITRTRKICTDSWSYGLRQHAIAVDAITVQRQGDTSPISLTIAFTFASPTLQATQDCAAIESIRVDNYCAVNGFAPGMSSRSTGYQYIEALPGAEDHYYSLVALRVPAHDGAFFFPTFWRLPHPAARSQDNTAVTNRHRQRPRPHRHTDRPSLPLYPVSSTAIARPAMCAPIWGKGRKSGAGEGLCPT